MNDKFGADRNVRTLARYVAALVPMISKEATRYYLNGVFVTPHLDGILLVATDGHRMGVIYDEGGQTNGDWICPVPPALRSGCKNKLADHIHFVGRSGYVTSEGFNASGGDVTEIDEEHIAVAPAPPIDGTYPDLRRIIPQEVPKQRLSFNRRYLSEFDGPQVELRPQDERSPSVVLLSDMPEFLGLLMPVYGGDHRPSPSWLTALFSADPAAEAAE